MKKIRSGKREKDLAPEPAVRLALWSVYRYHSMHLQHVYNDGLGRIDRKADACST